MKVRLDGVLETQPVSGTVAVTGTQTDGLTDSELRASDVPVSGTFFQATQPVSGTFWQTTQPVSGTVTSNNTPIASTPYKNLDIDESGDLVITGAKTLTGYYIYNNAATTLYVKFYDKATAPTVGTDTPKLTLAIPAGAAANRTSNITFALGFGVGATTGVADADTGAPAANDIVGSFDLR